MTLVNKRMVGQTLPALCAILRDRTGPVALSGYSVTFRMQVEATDVVKVIEASTHVVQEPTQTFTAASTGLATCNGHGVKEDDQIIVANSGGVLPTGLVAATRYFAVNVTPNAFGLASLPGGISVITAAGTGTNTFYIVGSVQYVWQAADVDTAGRFEAWFKGVSGSDFFAAPVSEKLIVEIAAFS